MKLNPNLRDFWLAPAKTRVLKGGRMSSKTHDAAGRAIHIARFCKVTFLCLRQYQARIAESVYTMLKNKIIESGLSNEFVILKNSIVHRRTGSSFHFYGMALHIDELRGFETNGPCICWIEEGNALTFEQYTVIKPTVRRYAGSEMWLIYNPKLVSDFVETTEFFRANPRRGIVERIINYDENPFLSEESLEEIMIDKEILTEAEFDHIYNGKPISDDENVIIKLSWINAAVDAHLKLPELDWFGGGVSSGFDVADGGKDLCANVELKGRVANYCDEWKAGEDELFESSARVYNRATISGASVNYDSIGVGAGVGANFNVMAEESGVIINHSGFNAGGAVLNPDEPCVDIGENSKTNKEHYSNIKAQAWWETAERFRNTYNAIKKGMEFDVNDLISIDSGLNNIEKLKTELSTPRRTFDKGGRVKVESKEDLAKRDVPSPNIADAFIMADAPKVYTPMSFSDFYEATRK